MMDIPLFVLDKGKYKGKAKITKMLKYENARKYGEVREIHEQFE